MEPRTVLEANIARLSPRDQDFARSLLSARWPSEKQAHWISTLAARATQPAPEPVTLNVAGVVKLLDRAAEHLKRPKLLLATSDGLALRLSVAGSRSSSPGAVDVTSAAGGFEGRVWYGRVTRSGEWEPSRRADPLTTTAIVSALRELAADPAGVAARYGRLTGVCCFCGLALTDARSTAVGYGPVCAEHWGMPWGEGSAQ